MTAPVLGLRAVSTGPVANRSSRNVGAALLFLSFMAPVADAAPPENADPAFAAWFQSLRAPNGGVCCSQSDCRTVDYRISAEHYDVLIGKQFGEDVVPHWEAVPPESIVNQVDNPTGKAVACWLPFTEPRVLCFVRPAET